MTDNRIKQIADINGIDTILNKLTEECGELVTAIARSQSTEFSEDTDTVADMFEEAADTLIMIEQLRLQSPFMFDMMYTTKVERQCERMGIK